MKTVAEEQKEIDLHVVDPINAYVENCHTCTLILFLFLQNDSSINVYVDHSHTCRLATVEDLPLTLDLL